MATTGWFQVEFDRSTPPGGGDTTERRLSERPSGSVQWEAYHSNVLSKVTKGLQKRLLVRGAFWPEARALERLLVVSPLLGGAVRS